MKFRIELTLFVLIAIFVFLPLYFLAHLIWWTLILLSVLDLPVWLLSGKTPIWFCADKVHNFLLEQT